MLLLELVNLHKANERTMNFTYANSKPAMLVAIPTAKNYSTFEKKQKKNKVVGFNNVIYWIQK